METLLIPNWFDELPLIAKIAIITAIVLYFVGGFITYTIMEDKDVFYGVEPNDKDLYIIKVLLLWWVYLPYMNIYQNGYEAGVADGKAEAELQRQIEMDAYMRGKLDGIDIEKTLLESEHELEGDEDPNYV